MGGYPVVFYQYEEYSQEDKNACNIWCELCKIMDPEYDEYYKSTHNEDGSLIDSETITTLKG